MKLFFALLIPTCVILLILFGMRNTDTSNTDVPTDPQPEVVVPPVPTPLPVTPPPVGVNDVRKLPHATSVGVGMWHFEGTPQSKDAGFSILYNENNKSFAIDIWRLPIATYRESAGNYFLQMLGISQVEACEQNVYLGVTADVSPDLSRKNLGLHYCPGSVEL